MLRSGEPGNLVEQVRQRSSLILRWSFVLLALFGAVFPFFWIGLSSLKPTSQIVTSVPQIIFTPTLENYATVWDNTFAKAYRNSIIITVANVFLALALGVPAAYALSRFRFPGRSVLFGTIFITRLLPWISFALPLYLIMARFGLVGTHLGTVLAYLVFNLPFGIWMMKSFFDEVPTSLEEAALIDGCSRFGAFTRVIVPIMTAPMAAMLILTFIFAWNHYLLGLVLAGRDSQTVVVLAAQYLGSADAGIEWGPLAAAGFSITAPIILVALVMNRYLVRGLTGSDVED